MSKSILFRQHHFLELLKTFDLEKGPIDVFVNLYFRHHPQLGSKDRYYIVERIYKYFRWKLLIEKRVLAGISLLEAVEESFPIQCEKGTPANVRVSFPEELFKVLERSLGEKTENICLICNESAPITIRANPLKTTKAEVQKRLRSYEIDAKEIEGVEYGLKLNRRPNLVSLQEFKDGFFEIQDAGSQKVADLVQAKPGEQVLDYCAGAGGKTLAFAHRMEGKGQILLHDVRKSALDEAKKRLRRAGVQNIQVVCSEERAKLSRLRGKMDWVLLDVPCSGTGTLRRNPDMKWKFSETVLCSLIQEQRGILKEGVSYLKSGGSLIYATCSILREENEEQAAWFVENFPVVQEEEPFFSMPSQDMDGFFAVKFRLK